MLERPVGVGAPVLDANALHAGNAGSEQKRSRALNRHKKSYKQPTRTDNRKKNKHRQRKGSEKSGREIIDLFSQLDLSQDAAKVSDVEVGSYVEQANPCDAAKNAGDAAKNAGEVSVDEQSEEKPDLSDEAWKIIMENDVAIMQRVDAPPDGNSWDWPLRRVDQKARVQLLERQMRAMDRNSLIKEVCRLSFSSARTSASSTGNDSISDEEEPCEEVQEPKKDLAEALARITELEAENALLKAENAAMKKRKKDRSSGWRCSSSDSSSSGWREKAWGGSCSSSDSSSGSTKRRRVA